MWTIKGTPHLLGIVANMPIHKEGSITADGLVLSISGALYLNLDARVNQKMSESPEIPYYEEGEGDKEDYNNFDEDEKDNEEDSEFDFFADEFDETLESFNIKRTSPKHDGYEIDLDGRYLKPVTEKTLYDILSKGNYIHMGNIKKSQDERKAAPAISLQAARNNPQKKVTTIDQFLKLPPDQQKSLNKKTLSNLLKKAAAQDQFETAIIIRNLLKNLPLKGDLPNNNENPGGAENWTPV